jgi:hypothetical protein
MHARIAAYVEVGTKRAFAGAVEWPGWCRAGRDERAAIEALVAYGGRYAKALRGTRLGFEAPNVPSGLRVTERLTGDATTDFGAPSIAPKADARPIDDAEPRRSTAILRPVGGRSTVPWRRPRASRLPRAREAAAGT